MPNFIMRFPGGKCKALTLSYDDGVEQDIKLLEIARKYGLRGTFNLNSGCYPEEGVTYEKGTIHRRMPKSQADKLYTDCGWEVAAHGYTHPGLVGMPLNLATKEILDDRRTLEEQFGHLVRGFAYPYGAYDDNVVEILRSCGIVYARTVISTHDFAMPKDWLRLPATCHHNDPLLMELAKTFVEFEMPWEPKLFYLWGHSYEFEAYDNWDVMEKFGEYVGGRDDIWYATNIEIYDYQHAFKELLFDVNASYVHNPTSTDVWFAYGEKEVYVPAGGTCFF